MTPPSLTRRIGARFVDVLVCVGLDGALGSVVGFGFDWLALGTVVVLLYFAGTIALTGTSIGKRVFGLKVLDEQGARPAFVAALRREAFTVLGAIPLVGPFLALGTWIWLVLGIRKDAEGRGPHDRFAGTRVVTR